MDYVAEPYNVDFYVENRPLTEEEKKNISDFIRRDKDKRKKNSGRLKKRKVVK